MEAYHSILSLFLINQPLQATLAHHLLLNLSSLSFWLLTFINLVFDHPTMSEEIFKQVWNAVKTGKPDMLLFDNVNPADFAHALESLRYPSNHFEEHSLR